MIWYYHIILIMLTTPNPHSKNYQVQSITSPERSPELDTLTEWIRVRIPDIFRENISPQMGTLLGQLPAFESLISRDHQLLSHELYYFLVSRGYESLPYTEKEREDYKQCVAKFVQKWNSLWAKINADVFIETEIVAGAPRWSTTYKYYQTFSEKSWKQCIDHLPELYGRIAREFSGKYNERISAKFPGNIQLFREKCDNLVIYCRNKENLPKIQAILDTWIHDYLIPSRNRPFYRSAFWVDAPPGPWEEKTSFSDLCAILWSKYAKQYNEWYRWKTWKELSNREYNILALGQACEMTKSDPHDIPAKTKR